MNNKRTIILLASLSALLSSCTGSSNVRLEAPTFEKASSPMHFTAYACPTVENWSGTSNNVNCATEEHYRKLAEAGFTKALALYEGAPGGARTTAEHVRKSHAAAEQDAMKILEQAEKFGIKYYVRDWSFYGLVKNYSDVSTKEQYEEIIRSMLHEDNPYINSPSFLGNYGHDEPNYDELAKIKDQVEIYNRVMKELGKDGAECVINLNPAYVSGAGLNYHTYSEYVDYYFENIAPLVGYGSFDFYPFLFDYVDGSYMRQMYLYNIELFARKCKEGGYELRSYIQDKGDFTGTRDMCGIGDFRFQIYTLMAFGARDITYYTYSGEESESEGGFALMNFMDGTYNWTYDLAKKVNNEVHAFEDAYLSYKWDGVMYKNANILIDNQNFANLVDPLESHDRVSFGDVSEDTLLTSFKNDEGDDAFMLVNFTDPYFKKNDTVTLKFNNARGLLMYRMGQKMVVPLNNGEYTFKLYPGEGRFIIPIK